MKVLMIYPLTPLSFFSYPKLFNRMGCKAFMPPLGLLTVAAGEEMFYLRGLLRQRLMGAQGQ